MKYIGENAIKKLISLIKGDLATKQDSITATGVLERDTTGVINGVETVGATLVETQEATLVDVPNGLLKGDGTTISAAVAGTDYVNSNQAIRYDAAQTLTDAQKTRARANIAAAPSGFGWGNELPKLASTAAEVDAITANSIVRYANDSTNLVDGDISSYTRYAIVVTYTVNENDKAQDVYGYGGGAHGDVMLHRGGFGNTWLPWEWVNPPMQLGVEYRTTERYLGKPVYIRLEEIAALPNDTTLTVSKVGVPSGGTLYVDNIVDYRAEFYFNSAVFSIPYNDVVDIPECNGSRYGGGITYSIRTKGVDYSNYAGRIWIKYTKQTD